MGVDFKCGRRLRRNLDLRDRSGERERLGQAKISGGLELAVIIVAEHATRTRHEAIAHGHHIQTTGWNRFEDEGAILSNGGDTFSKMFPNNRDIVS